MLGSRWFSRFFNLVKPLVFVRRGAAASADIIPAVDATVDEANDYERDKNGSGWDMSILAMKRKEGMSLPIAAMYLYFSHISSNCW